MNAQKTLTAIKILHTVIWIFFNVVIFYLFYAALTNRIDKYIWIGFGFILLEGITLLLFKNICPITIVARKYSNSTKDNFDIYLPDWLARWNKQIYSAILFIIILILLYQAINN